MSDAAQTTNNPPPITNEPPITPAQRGLWTSGLRIEQAEGVPPEYVGKSAQEIVQMAETYRSAMNAPPQYQQQAQYQAPQQVPVSFQGPQAPDPQLLYSNPQAYQRQLDEYNDFRVEQRIQQAAQPLLASNAQQSKWASRNDPEYAEVWTKYGHEIEAMAVRVPQHMLTLEAYNTFADIVRGKHWKDFVENRAQQLAASGGFGTERSANGGAPPVTPTSALDRLFDPRSDHPESRKKRELGTSRQDFERFCQAMGKNPEQHAELILNGGVLAA